MFRRIFADIFSQQIEKSYVHILFGARQTGKSTVIRYLLPQHHTFINLAFPSERLHYQSNPSAFVNECYALPREASCHYIFIDEAQTVPALFDAVQALYDQDKSRWRFILCGSSARKLRATGANLLPGRSFLHHLYPLVMQEQPVSPHIPSHGPGTIVSLALDSTDTPALFPPFELLERLSFGALPGVVTAPEEDRSQLLRSYAAIYLEEEVRREVAIRNWSAFARFVQLAALSSGHVINYTALSKETGIAVTTIKQHYQLLEDIFIGFRVHAWTQSSRKNLLSTPRFHFFDLGVRHAAAGLNPGKDCVLNDAGSIFEQWVVLELWKRLRYRGHGSLFYLRTRDGFEIDCIVDIDDEIIPIEIKWTENPDSKDARHLVSFIKESGNRCKRGYVVCRCPRPRKLADTVTAIPWHEV